MGFGHTTLNLFHHRSHAPGKASSSSKSHTLELFWLNKVFKNYTLHVIFIYGFSSSATQPLRNDEEGDVIINY